MDYSRHILIIAVLLASVACGPPRIGSSTTGEGTDSDELGADATSTGTTSTGTTDSETSDPETSTDESSTDAFLPRWDIVPIDPCDPFQQDCPEGEKCVPYASMGGPWNAHKCVPVMGDQAPGEPCWYGGAVAATDNCDETSMCWNVTVIDGELVGTCTILCTGSADTPECPEGSSCSISGDGSVYVCISNCDPLLQDCGPGLACYWANGIFTCIFSIQDIPTGEPCDSINACAIGNGCVIAEVLPSCVSAACCTLFCNVMLGDQQCDALPGTSCVPFFEQGMAPPGYELVGLCILP
jgi:hypothetical protein